MIDCKFEKAYTLSLVLNGLEMTMWMAK
jgi:hypothetical protein